MPRRDEVAYNASLSDDFRDLEKYKAVFLGDQGSGKTSIVIRFIYGSFHGSYQGTIGIDFLSTVIHNKEGNPVQLQIWDTAGQERFYSLIPAYIRDSRVIFVVYDVTSKDGLSKARRWLETIQREASNPLLVLLGNKCDLSEERQVSEQTGREFAEKYNMMFLETSAKTGFNIDEAIKRAIRSVTARHKPIVGTPAESQLVEVVLEPDSDSQDKCFCF